MAQTPNFTPDVEAAAERIKQTSERVLALSKENGLVWLEAYEKMLNGVLKLEEDTAKDLSSDWVETLVSTQTDFIRETSQAYLGAFKDSEVEVVTRPSGRRVALHSYRVAAIRGLLRRPCELTDRSASFRCAGEFAGQSSARQRQSWGNSGEIVLGILHLNLYCGEHFTVGEHWHRDAVVSDFQFTRRHGNPRLANCAEVMSELVGRHDCVSRELRETLREEPVGDACRRERQQHLAEGRRVCGQRRSDVKTRNRVMRSFLYVLDLAA